MLKTVRKEMRKVLWRKHLLGRFEDRKVLNNHNGEFDNITDSDKTKEKDYTSQDLANDQVEVTKDRLDVKKRLKAGDPTAIIIIIKKYSGQFWKPTAITESITKKSLAELRIRTGRKEAELISFTILSVAVPPNGPA